MTLRVLWSAATAMLARVPMLDPGKTLTDPLLLFLFVTIALLIVAMRRGDAATRRIAFAALVLSIALWFLATPFGCLLLTRSLEVPADSDAIPPDVIAVLSAGSVRFDQHELNMPSSASSTRVVAAAMWWRQHPRARFILAGADSWPGGRSTRTLAIMRDVAIAHGVTPQAIEFDGWSTSTREHPLGVLRLRGITPSTRIGVVTSSSHMRRAAREFRRHFRYVIAHPAPPMQPIGPFVNDVLPSSASLASSKVALDEWIGTAWYALSR
jgi:uncharacterized SAM-binding protein YcdF (DUF218 family)